MTHPRRVVAAFHHSDPGGPLRALAPVLARLAEQGAEVVSVVPRPGRAADELAQLGRVVALGHDALTLPRDPATALALAPRLRAEARRFRAVLRRERADFALVATTTLPALTLAARLERVPSIVWAAELYRQGTHGDPVRFRVGRTALRVNARLATVTVPISHAVARLLPRGTASVVVYPAIEAPSADGDAGAFRRRHAIPAARPCLATLGNVARGRGQDVAIRALADLRRDHPEAQLVVAGTPHPRPADRAYAAELEALAARLGVRDAVHLCGFARAEDVFAVADIVLNPARFAETFGIASTEALAAGRPVVSTDVGAIPEVLHDGRHALLVPPDRPDAMAAAVRRLLDEPALSERLVAAGREHVLRSFSAERQLPRFERAIQLALARGR